MSWFNRKDKEEEEEELAPTDRGIEVPTINTLNCTYTEYVQARCSSLLIHHYETGDCLIDSGESLAEKLEKGYEMEVLKPSFFRW